MFDHNQAGRDFVAMSRTFDGIETRDPHADRRLLEFLLKVPEPMYARTACRARLPAPCCRPPAAGNSQRAAQGYQAATWFRRMDARRAEIAAEVEQLAASPLASRLIDVPRLKRVLAAWPKDENPAQATIYELNFMFGRAEVNIGNFIRWVEGGTPERVFKLRGLLRRRSNPVHPAIDGKA